MKHIKYISVMAFLMVLTNLMSQSVGIGTTTPHSASILDLTSTNKGLLMPRISDASSNILNPTSGLLIFDADREKSYIYASNTWNEIIFPEEMPFNISGNRIIPFSNGAKLGLGLSNPTAKLHINHRSLATTPFITMVDSATGSGQLIQISKLGSTNSFKFNTTLNSNSSTSFLSFFSGANTTSILQLQANNRVSINKNSAAEVLDVAGNIKSDTLKSSSIIIPPNAGEGKVLTSNAQGVASWQNPPTVTANNLGDGYWGDCTTNLYLEDYQVVYDTLSENGDNFGHSVSIDGSFAAVGVSRDNLSKGSVTIYKLINGKWHYFQKLEDPTGSSNDQFGSSVCLKGTRLIVGAPFDDDNGSNRGSVCIYHYNGTSWVFIVKLLGENAGDIFGSSVAIDSNLVVVGAPYNDFGAQTRAGSIRVFQYNGSAWSLINTTDNPDPDANDYFGTSVALDSIYFLVGAPEDDDLAADNKGKVSFFKLNGNTPVLLNSFFGTGTNAKSGEVADMYEDKAVVGVNYAGSALGVIQVYSRTGDIWSKIQTISDPFLDANSYFGSAVALNNNYLVVGAKRQALGNQPDVGAMVLYKRNGNQYRKIISVDNPGGLSTNAFGSSVAISSANRFVVGAPYINTAAEPGYCSFGRIKL